jgi:hypothetical protein
LNFLKTTNPPPNFYKTADLRSMFYVPSGQSPVTSLQWPVKKKRIFLVDRPIFHTRAFLVVPALGQRGLKLRPLTQRLAPRRGVPIRVCFLDGVIVSMPSECFWLERFQATPWYGGASCLFLCPQSRFYVKPA